MIIEKKIHEYIINMKMAINNIGGQCMIVSENHRNMFIELCKEYNKSTNIHLPIGQCSLHFKKHNKNPNKKGYGEPYFLIKILLSMYGFNYNCKLNLDLQLNVFRFDLMQNSDIQYIYDNLTIKHDTMHGKNLIVIQHNSYNIPEIITVNKKMKYELKSMILLQQEHFTSIIKIKNKYFYVNIAKTGKTLIEEIGLNILNRQNIDGVDYIQIKYVNMLFYYLIN